MSRHTRANPTHSPDSLWPIGREVQDPGQVQDPSRSRGESELEEEIELSGMMEKADHFERLEERRRSLSREIERHERSMSSQGVRFREKEGESGSSSDDTEKKGLPVRVKTEGSVVDPGDSFALSSGEDVSQWALVGKEMGLRGEALGRFVTDSIRNAELKEERREELRLKKRRDDEELRLKKRRDEEDKFRLDEALRLKKIRDDEELRLKEEELRLKARREEEDKFRLDEELRLKARRDDEELKYRREEVDSNRDYQGKRLENDETKNVKIEPLGENYDVDAFVAHFEQVAGLCKWSKASWSSRIIALLKGKAREAVLRLTSTQLTDYDEVKTALLVHFRLDAEAYRKKFRGMRKEVSETFEQALTRMKRWFSLWCKAAKKDETDVDDVKDLLLQEQMYRMFNSEFTVEVRRTCPRTVDEVAREATVFAEAKWMGREERRDRDNALGPTGVRQGNKPPSAGQPIEQTSQGDKQSKPAGSGATYPGSQIVCFRCKKKGHVSRHCPEKILAVMGTGSSGTEQKRGPTPALCGPCSKKSYSPNCVVSVNGSPVKGLRDTGSGFTVVAERLVPAGAYTGEAVNVVLAESRHTSKLAVAVVEIDSPFLRGQIEVLVMKQPVVEVLIGNYAKRRGESTWVPVPVYADRELIAPVQTRAQKVRATGQLPDLSVKTNIMGTTRDRLIELQQSDESLKKTREAYQKQERFSTKTGVVWYIQKGGVLMRQHQCRDDTVTQVIVPKELRVSVMTLGHDIPMAGHLGTRKTKDRIFLEFYWPGMCGDIRRYCQSCVSCQRTIDKGRVPRAPMVKMPLAAEPFSRVGMDIIGPMNPMSEGGYRYVLVMVDYATRYPEATPLKNIRAETVAEAAFDMWTRTGIPESVLTDNGSQFTGQVMKEVYRLLAIKGQYTTPYHAQCNGLVERFNGTLKRMLRSLVQDKPKQWDRWIPALLFAYREVPQSSTGFSPFELLYGRKVRGPMRVLKDLWVQPERQEVKTAAEYVVDLRNKIAETCAVARENLGEAATKHKRHFDLRARPRSLRVGSRALVLRPTSHSKLELAWQGPYEVVGKVGEVDYKLRIGGKVKLYHVNLLRQFVERVSPAGDTVAAIVIEEEVERGPETVVVTKDIPVISLEASEGPQDVEILTEDEVFASQLREVTASFSQVLTDVPSCTTLETCHIKVRNEKPVRCKPYPVPFAQRETVREEVKSMLSMGVIEPSVSPYCSPIVLVKKRDGKIRFCVDFRQLNKVVEFDSEPMPDVEYLFAKLGDKKVFSKIDLSKGYWQIPLEEGDKPKTAFSTPEGHFQWKVMPFGLCTSGAVFSRMMRKLLQPLQSEDVDNFIDDILIATVDNQEHIKVLKAVLQRLQDSSLTARPSKCSLGGVEVTYLGHKIGKGEIRPGEDKMAQILEAPRPTTKKQVRSFLGLIGYYRRFVPHFAEVAKPLTDLTKGAKARVVVWNEQCEQAFQSLKRVFCEPPVCNLPVSGRRFVLQTDASENGIGAMLCQEYEDGLRPVSCASKKLKPAELNYPIIEKECLAMVWGIQHFERYLYGNAFLVQTDHSPLQYLDRVKSASGRITRWALLLQPFQFTIEAIPEKENVSADFLSRIPDKESVPKVRTVQGDVFSCPPSEALAHCVSQDLEMGAGIAAEFKARFGGLQELKKQGKVVGEVAVLKREGRFVYYLVT
ncbi:hypothetical protein ACOMHN_049608 [Nucella lapillus]